MKTSNRSQLSTQDQQNRVRDYRLVQLLKNSQLGCWLSEICSGRVALQLLTAGLFLLFVWLLAELHMVLPCFLLCGCLFHSSFRRAVNTIWAWLTAPVGDKVVEKVPHTDGCTGIKCEKAWWNTKPSLYCNLTETSIFILFFCMKNKEGLCLNLLQNYFLVLIESLVLVVIEILPGNTCMSLPFIGPGTRSQPCNQILIMN